MIRTTTRCPNCGNQVTNTAPVCPSCAAVLIQRRFTPSLVLLYGCIALLIALLVSVLILPMTFIAIIYALFARKRLHNTTFESDDDGETGADDATTPTGAVSSMHEFIHR